MKSRGRGHSRRTPDKQRHFAEQRALVDMNLGNPVGDSADERRLFATRSLDGVLLKGVYSVGGVMVFLSRKENTAWRTR